MNKLYRLSIIICLISLFACKSSEKARRKDLEGKKTEYLLEQMNKNALQFNTLSYKANVKFEGEEGKKSFKAHFRLRKDSAIWISIRALNVEVARVLITDDTVKVINRFNKQYFVGDYTYINKRFNIVLEFELLQALLVGNPIDLESDDKLNFATVKNFYYLGNLKKRKARKAEDKPQKIERKDEEVFSIWLDASSFRISKVLMSDLSANRFIQGTFKEYIEIEGQKIPQLLEFNIQSENPSSLNMEYSKIELNKSFNFPFKISSKYEQVFY